MTSHLEIERKFLVYPERWQAQSSGKKIAQGYVTHDKGKGVVVRVRQKGDACFLTIKAEHGENTRMEFEYEIPKEDCDAMLAKLCGDAISKTRFEVPFKGNIWEVDEFHGVNAGLMIAEVELESPDQSFEKPDWLGPEVSNDPRFFNSYISENPFTSWGVTPKQLLEEIEEKA